MVLSTPYLTRNNKYVDEVVNNGLSFAKPIPFQVTLDPLYPPTCSAPQLGSVLLSYRLLALNRSLYFLPRCFLKSYRMFKRYITLLQLQLKGLYA